MHVSAFPQLRQQLVVHNLRTGQLTTNLVVVFVVQCGPAPTVARWLGVFNRTTWQS